MIAPQLLPSNPFPTSAVLDAKRPVRFERIGEDIVVRIVLPRGEVATIDAADYISLCARGIRPNWTLSGNGTGRTYVRASAPASFDWKQHAVSVARMIACPEHRGQVVRYRDGNPLNLRRNNLSVTRMRKANAHAREQFIDGVEQAVRG